MADYNELSDGRPAGAMLGQKAADLIGFHGETPTIQYVATVTVGTDIATVILELAELRLMLVTKGLIDA